MTFTAPPPAAGAEIRDEIGDLRTAWSDQPVAGSSATALVLAIAFVSLVTFVLGTTAPEPVMSAASVQDVVRTFDRATAMVSWLVHVGGLAAVGATFFRFVVIGGAPAKAGGRSDGADIRTPVEQLVLAGIALASVASAATLPLRAAVVAGRAEAASEVSAIWFVIMSPYGASALLRITGLLLLAVVVRQGPSSFHRPIAFVRGELNVIGGIAAGPVTVARVKAGLCVALVLGSYSVVGHAQASSPRLMLMGAQLVHLAAGAVWFGGVLALVLVARRLRREGDAGEAAAVLGRFSLSAALAVGAVAVSGTVLAMGQLGGVSGFWSTAYGRTLLAKLALVALVMAIGGYNHRVLVPAVVERNERSAWTVLYKTVVCEAGVLAGGVLVVTAALLAGGLEGMVAR